MEIKVLKDILGANEQIAQNNRALLDSQGVFAINLMSSPGAGKTSLIVQTIRGLKDKARVGVIEGDISSSRDAETVSKERVPVVQINTGGQCHLDANMVQNALSSLPLADINLLIIENVGNLVCPAEFALGEDCRVMISSTPEGDDKPLKYPAMFQDVNALLINKVDLLPYVNFDVALFTRIVQGMNKKVSVFPVSCTTGQGMERWLSWLQDKMAKE
jgi:hydrogenase nickel incorporation protein HypB